MEKIAALEAKIEYWQDKRTIANGGQPDWLCDNLGGWHASLAAARVRRDRLSAFLSEPNTTVSRRRAARHRSKMNAPNEN